MKSIDKSRIIAVSCILAGHLLVAGCAEEHKAAPKPARPSTHVDENADVQALRNPHSGGQRQNQEAIVSRMERAEDKARRLTTDLALARQATQEHSKELANARGKLAALARRLEGSEATTRQLSAQLQASRTGTDETQTLLEEWVAYAQELELREKAYDEYIESQNQVIQKLAAQQQAAVPDQERPPRIPKRLVPSKNKAVSRAQFFSIVRGMTLDELRNYVGAPSAIEGNPPEEYIYSRGLTYASDASKPDSSVRIIIEGGRVQRCLYTE